MCLQGWMGREESLRTPVRRRKNPDQYSPEKSSRKVPQETSQEISYGTSTTTPKLKRYRTQRQQTNASVMKATLFEASLPDGSSPPCPLIADVPSEDTPTITQMQTDTGAGADVADQIPLSETHQELASIAITSCRGVPGGKITEIPDIWKRSVRCLPPATVTRFAHP